ncbi:MAG: hypothetical protein WC746_06905 [archaeon]
MLNLASVEPVSVKVMWDYTAFPLWASDADVDALPLSTSLRSELQDWSDRVTDVMWGAKGPDAPDYREPSASVIEGLRKEGLALTDRVRVELPEGSVVWFFPEEGV